MDVLIALLLVAQVACDWVEIAQQPYKKAVSVRPTYSHPLLAAVTGVTKKQPDPTSTAESKVYSNITLQENNWNKGTILRVPNVGNVKRIPAKTAVVRTPTNINKATSLETTTLVDKPKVDYKHTYSPLKTLDEPKPEFVTNVKNFRDEYEIKNEYSTQNIEENSEVVIEKTFGEVEKANKQTLDTTNRDDFKYSNGTHGNEEHEEIVGQRESKTKIDENASKDTKSDIIKNLLAFLSVVAQTISKNTQWSLKSKLRYLEDLKETILENIENRIDAMWPDEEIEAPASRAARRARSVGRDAGGGEAQPASSRAPVEFPSSESSLMTISFLTFAVFLIKLVLQVIVTYKGNSMMVTPAVVAVGRAASHFAKQQPRH